VIVPALHLWIGLGLLLLAAGLRAATPNRLVRRKLQLAIAVSFAALVLGAVLRFGQAPPDLVERLRSIEVLLLLLAAISLFIVAAVNPLTVDRIPARFPSILQDAIVTGLFALAATIVLQEKFLTTSAVGAVVVGFALQDTLGNAFSGLAIQTEKPFRVGEWIRVGEHEGRVEEITWRATKLRTRADTFLIVPNSVMSREAIENFSEPVLPTQVWVEVGVTYAATPAQVKAAMLEAVRNAPLALAEPAPDVLLMDFGSSAIVYRARFWVQDYGEDIRARDQVRTNIYYSLRRHDLEIPFPIQVEYSREETPPDPVARTARFAEVLRATPVLAALDETHRQQLAGAAIERLYTNGERVVGEGDPGASMFVVASGRVRVTVGEPPREVAVIERGGLFGEMSLLTGQARTATVTAAGETALLEITADAFRRFVLDDPGVLEPITAAVSQRRVELERARAALTGAALPPADTSLLAVVRRFLRLDA
jgi:small-conductance mechanosensitive channel/CRP-like cAMP-binding protein